MGGPSCIVSHTGHFESKSIDLRQTVLIDGIGEIGRRCAGVFAIRYRGPPSAQHGGAGSTTELCGRPAPVALDYQR
jgi:hypothetical protein